LLGFLTVSRKVDCVLGIFCFLSLLYISINEQTIQSLHSPVSSGSHSAKKCKKETILIRAFSGPSLSKTYIYKAAANNPMRAAPTPVPETSIDDAAAFELDAAVAALVVEADDVVVFEGVLLSPSAKGRTAKPLITVPELVLTTWVTL